eukprot:GHVL01030176.1.p1 GENE.GHVL01030176.1~~GHVL01030176.1.p1  ORF type:complete len:413 (-),score=107.65 GHVL01030176.1:145-1383(-)
MQIRLSTTVLAFCSKFKNFSKMQINQLSGGYMNISEPVKNITDTVNIITDINDNFNPIKSNISIDEKYKICRSIGEECQMENELLNILKNKDNPICYDGFEPSGRMHIAQGILKSLNVNKLTSCGCIFKFWIADWFAMLNNKLDGDINKIKIVGKYFIEVWKAAGMNMSNVQFLWASDEINNNSNNYWITVMDIARKNTLTRIKRCGQIMGRGEDGDEIPAAQIMYPCMQCADIFHLKADICQLGMDQRKVNMLAREYAEATKQKKPVILSHGMLPGLLEGQAKMSKSDPDSAIFMEDNEQEVNRKIKKAFCPPQISDSKVNPCVCYVEDLVFGKFGEFFVERKDDNGGNITFADVNSFKEAYQSGALHPGDLKSALAKSLNKMIQPVRDHFTNDQNARELLAKVKAFKITR